MGLAYFKDCKNLTNLYLAGTKVSDAGLAHFKDKSLNDVVDLTTPVSPTWSPLQGMPLEEIRLTPKNITRGLDILRDMKSLKTIGIAWDQDWPAARNKTARQGVLQGMLADFRARQFSPPLPAKEQWPSLVAPDGRLAWPHPPMTVTPLTTLRQLRTFKKNWLRDRSHTAPGGAKGPAFRLNLILNLLRSDAPTVRDSVLRTMKPTRAGHVSPPPSCRGKLVSVRPQGPCPIILGADGLFWAANFVEAADMWNHVVQEPMGGRTICR